MPFQAEAPRPPFGKIGERRLRAEPARITSYNVCYTKLLRLAANRNGMDREALNKQVRVALGKFAFDSGIYTALDSHFSNIGGQ